MTTSSKVFFCVSEIALPPPQLLGLCYSMHSLLVLSDFTALARPEG